MCGRYYVDDDTAREIEKIVRDLDKKMQTGGRKDIHPSENAVVLSHKANKITAEMMRWGFPGYQGKGLLINARAEGALEKPTFRESILHRRCIIPARGFYEWNRQKEKIMFYRADTPVLWMAGCFREYGEEKRFVILTTNANVSVSSVHDRMPLILEQPEAEDWILDDQFVECLLRKTPALLERNSSYEQMTLF